MTENLLPSGPTTAIKQAGQVAWALVGVAALVAVVGIIAWYVRVIFPPLVLGGAIVFILNPVVTALQHRGVPRAAGAGLAYLGVLAIIGAAGIGLFPIAANQVDELAEDLPAIQARVERWVDDRAEQSVGTFYEFSRADVENSLSNSSATFEDQLRSLRKIGASVFHGLLIVVLAPIIAFYLLVDVPHMRKVGESLIPIGARDEVLVVAHRLNRAIGGFFRGQLMVALIVGVLCSIGLGLIGLKFWFLIGMIAGLFNVIPLIGPWVGGVPGVTIALTTGSPVKALLVVVVMVAVQQIDNHFITPQVMQRAVHLHPAVVILALVAGGSLGGFYGLLLAVPLAAVLKIIVSHVWRVHVLRQPLEPVEVEAEVVDTEQGKGMVDEVESHPENQPVPAAANR
ncbi:MAG: AI-2E family transporter [Actinomycetota bacterium]|nr:AI-2E family transporter [Actinomycetota bacterium]